MHHEAIAGFLAAWSATLILVGLLCFWGQALGFKFHLQAPPPGSLEIPPESRGAFGPPLFSLFGAFCATLALYFGGSAWFLAAEDFEARRTALLVLDAGRVFAVFLFAHFTIANGGLRLGRLGGTLLYGAALAFEVAALSGAVLRVSPGEHVASRLVGLEIVHPVVRATPLGLVLAAFQVAVLAAAAWLSLRSHRRGRGGSAALLGTVFLGITACYDAVQAFLSPGGFVFGPFGYVVFVVGVLVSFVTSYLRLQSELATRTRELTRSREALETAQRELVRKEQLAAVGELSAVVAHEVRNPLAILTTAVASLRRPELPAVDRETLFEILDEETSRLNRIVGDLLVYARPLTLDLQPVLLRDVTERALGLARGRKDLVVELRERGEGGEARVEPVAADPGLLRQVLENLVTNALQAMPERAGREAHLTVTLAASRRGEVRGVELRVDDSGEGMSTTVRSRALDPFFTTRASGTGLGLAIVARIVEAHGGSLDIVSQAGRGTSVRVFLPRGEPEALSAPASAGATTEKRVSET